MKQSWFHETSVKDLTCFICTYLISHVVLLSEFKYLNPVKHL